MSENERITKLRQALAEVQQSGQQAVDIPALLEFIGSLEGEAPLDPEIRKLNHDSQLAHYRAQHESNLAQYKATIDSSNEMFRSVMEAAKVTLSTSIFVNGGAAVALLAFIGNAIAKLGQLPPNMQASLVFSLVAFSGGVLAGVVATGGTYCAQLCYHHGRMKSGAGFHVLTFLLVVSSYVAFALGVAGAYRAFT